MFYSVITKNLNGDILGKNKGFTKNQYMGKNCRQGGGGGGGGAWTVGGFREGGGGLGIKEGGGVFEEGLIP